MQQVAVQHSKIQEERTVMTIQEIITKTKYYSPEQRNLEKYIQYRKWTRNSPSTLSSSCALNETMSEPMQNRLTSSFHFVEIQNVKKKELWLSLGNVKDVMQKPKQRYRKDIKEQKEPDWGNRKIGRSK